MKFMFVTYSGDIAVLGTFDKVKLIDIKRYVKEFPIHWITA